VPLLATLLNRRTGNPARACPSPEVSPLFLAVRRLAWPTLTLLCALAAAALAAPPAPTKPAATPAKPAAAPPAPRDEVALDAIAAMVNDEPVLASDVEEQLFLFLQRAQARPDSAQVDTLRRQVLDQLIDEKLLLAEAKRQSVTVSPAEVAKQVDRAIADAKQRLGGEQGFQQQLQRENTTEARLRERYRTDLERQMLGERVVKKMLPVKPVPQAEAESYYLAHMSEFPKVPPQLRLQVIQITPSPDSAALKAGRAKIEAIRKRLVAGEKFAKVAAETSDDPSSANAGGDLSFFRRGQMDPGLEDAAFALAPGKLSQPVKTVYGWHLVETIERDTVRSPAGKDSLDAQGKPIEEVHARHILVKVTPTDADVDRAFELAKRVRQQAAAKGADYAALVKRHSNYQGMAGPDGDVGFLSLSQLQPNIRAGLESLQPGDVSEVLTNQQGFNIFKVTERKPERPYELSEIREELPEAVAQAQFRVRYDAWMKTLRSKAQIEYRDL
jgi:peptidyl-prolyl cis-trans isomerase SurA